jgi:DNA primase
LHQAKGPIRKEESVILVEGYFDVIRLSLAGVEHVVAPLGTALTPDQAGLLKRFAPAATLLYDSDQPGLRASFRAGDELLRHGVRVRVATLPPGEDPDTLVRTGGIEALDLVLRDAIDLLERKIQLLELKGWFEGVEHRRAALDRLLPTIRATADPITRELYLSLVAKRAGVNQEVLESELAIGRAAGQRGSGAATGARNVADADPRPARARIGPEIQLLKTMLWGPEWIARAREEIAPSLLESARLREVFEVLLQAEEAASQLPPGLSEDAQAAWSRLKEASQELSSGDVVRIYDRASQILRARPEYEKIAAISDPGEKRRRRNELQRLYPEADRWYSVVRGVRSVKRWKGA